MQKEDNATRKMFRCNDVRLYFRFFVPFFSPEIAAKWKLRTPFAFFPFRTLEQLVCCAAVCTCNYVFGAKRVFFWRCRRIFRRNERKLQLEAPGNTFCFRNSDSLKYVAAFPFRNNKKNKSLRLNFTLEKNPTI